jgi:hypothetical protein
VSSKVGGVTRLRTSPVYEVVDRQRKCADDDATSRFPRRSRCRKYRSHFFERQRSRYASRGVGYLVLLNGISALILLACLARLSPQVEHAGRVVDAMLIFGAGAAIALGSTFFAYLRRTVRLQAPQRVPLRIGLWWLSLLAAIAGTACFLIGLNMAGRAVLPELESRADVSKGTAHKFKGNQRRGQNDFRRNAKKLTSAK